MTGIIEDSIYWGGAQNGLTSAKFVYPAGVRGSVMNFEGTNRGIVMEGPSTSTDHLSSETVVMENSVFRDNGTPAGMKLCGSYGDDMNFFIRRLIFMGADFNTNGPGNGCFDATGATVDIDGLIMTQSDGANNDPFSWIASGSTVANVCMHSARADQSVLFTTPSETTLGMTNLGPLATDDFTLRAMIGDPDSTHPCEKAKPTHLGFSRFGISHARRGDLTIKNHWRYSSEDLIQPVTAH